MLQINSRKKKENQIYTLVSDVNRMCKKSGCKVVEVVCVCCFKAINNQLRFLIKLNWSVQRCELFNKSPEMGWPLDFGSALIRKSTTCGNVSNNTRRSLQWITLSLLILFINTQQLNADVREETGKCKFMRKIVTFFVKQQQ